MERVTLRRATRDDADAIATIEQRCFAVDALPLLSIVQYLEIFPGSCLVALRGGMCVGFILAGVAAERPKIGWILDIAVDPSAHRGGVARELTDAMLDLLRARGVDAVFATIAPSNEASAALFRRAGFVVDRFARDYFGPGEDRSVVRLDLT